MKTEDTKPETENRDYSEFVRERSQIIAECGGDFHFAAPQMICMPVKFGGDDTFYSVIPDEYGGGHRWYATEILANSERRFPETVFSGDFIGAASLVLAKDLEAADKDQGGYNIVKGMAVVHENHGSGEVISVSTRDLGDGTPAAADVEFGNWGHSETVPLADLSVDWEYYRDESNIHRVRSI